MSVLIQIGLALAITALGGFVLKLMTRLIGGGFLFYWQGCIVMLLTLLCSYIPSIGPLLGLIVSYSLVYHWGELDSAGRCFLTVLISDFVSIGALVGLIHLIMS